MVTLLVSIIAGCIFGTLESIRLTRRNPGTDITTIHQAAPYLVPGTLIAIALAAALIVIGIHPGFFWSLPTHLGLAYRHCLWALILFLIAFLFSLSAATTFRSKHPYRWTLLIVGILFVAALFFLQHRLYRPIASTLTEALGADGFILQSSSVSCAAASGANIANAAGVVITEREMAERMGTCMLGTELPRLERAMAELGFESRRIHTTESDISRIKAPAMLFIDHPSAGPESHVVAFFGCRGDTSEIWDPLVGRIQMHREWLLSCWHGRAVEISYHLVEFQ